MFEVELTFSPDLTAFLRRDLRGENFMRRMLSEKTAAKDVIEACGVPHTEVNLIVAETIHNGERQVVDFGWPVQTPIRLEIFGVFTPPDFLPVAPRLQVRTWSRFIADGHLGKLARNLRLLGLDTAYERDANDRRLLEIMIAENRALLTRDRRLLMHSTVQHGYCPRSVDAEEQTREVLRRFELPDSRYLAPYSRCLRCNALIESVKKADVLNSLSAEPLTLNYYHDFRRCTGCGAFYWRGTHFDKLASRLQRLTDHGSKR